LDRLDKVKHITSYFEKKNETFPLRVCYMDKGRKLNCCRCEKCYRTIVEIIIEGKDPNNYGFAINEETFKCMEYDMKNRILLGHTKNWERIQKHLNEKKEIFENDERLNWIYDYDFSKVNKPFRKKVYRVYFAIRKRVRKYILRINE